MAVPPPDDGTYGGRAAPAPQLAAADSGTAETLTASQDPTFEERGYENPANSWVALVTALKEKNGYKIQRMMQTARQSAWTFQQLNQHRRYTYQPGSTPPLGLAPGEYMGQFSEASSSSDSSDSSSFLDSQDFPITQKRY